MKQQSGNSLDSVVNSLWRRLSGVWIGCMIFILASCSQSAAEKFIYRGMVYDQENKPIFDARVSISINATSHTVQTDSEGNYIFVIPSLQQIKSLNVTARGYTAYSSDTVTVEQKGVESHIPLIVLKPLTETSVNTQTSVPILPLSVTPSTIKAPTLGPTTHLKGKITFVSTHEMEKGANIYVMNADGTQKRRLTNAQEQTFNLSPRWSPDGGTIAFDGPGAGNNDIYLIQEDGSGLINLTNSSEIAEHTPAWSPDGKKIVYVGYQPTNMGTTSNMYVINNDGSGNKLLVSGLDFLDNPTWSPDGSRIAFSAYDHDNLTITIFIMDADGTNIKRLLPQKLAFMQAQYPQWSPTGEYILFNDSTASYIIDSNRPAHESNLKRITSYDVNAIYSNWSPDGNQIAYISFKETSPTSIELAVIDLGGSRPKLLHSQQISGVYKPTLARFDWHK